MNIDIVISADDIKEEKIKNKSVVVIDMLRATSVITTAINNGCTGVIPVLTIEQALEIADKDRKKYMLGGERKALKIEGFDFSNSPLEYNEEVIKGRTLIMTTSNGTRAIKGSRSAKNILIGALINANAVAKKLVSLGNDVMMVNAGTYGEFSMDDFICSGYIVDCLLNKSHQIQLMDITKTAHYIYKQNENITSFVKHASHYQRMKELNLDDDLEYCFKKDIIDIVPEYINDIITLCED